MVIGVEWYMDSSVNIDSWVYDNKHQTASVKNHFPNVLYDEFHCAPPAARCRYTDQNF